MSAVVHNYRHTNRISKGLQQAPPESSRAARLPKARARAQITNNIQFIFKKWRIKVYRINEHFIWLYLCKKALKQDVTVTTAGASAFQQEREAHLGRQATIVMPRNSA